MPYLVLGLMVVLAGCGPDTVDDHHLDGGSEPIQETPEPYDSGVTHDSGVVHVHDAGVVEDAGQPDIEPSQEPGTAGWLCHEQEECAEGFTCAAGALDDDERHCTIRCSAHEDCRGESGTETGYCDHRSGWCDMTGLCYGQTAEQIVFRAADCPDGPDWSYVDLPCVNNVVVLDVEAVCEDLSQ